MILCIHRQKPNWPDTEERQRFVVHHGGRQYWVETDGDQPIYEDVVSVLEGTIEGLKAGLSCRVDDDAEAVRMRYLTPGSGMAMVYQEKFAQAQAVNAMGETAANAMSQVDREAQFPTLAASVGLEAPSLWGCAQLVLGKYAAFAALSLGIERSRLTAKSQIKSASTVQSVRDAYEAIAWPTP